MTTDLTLNLALASKLEALRLAWMHDSIAESVATILDSAMHNWQLPLPAMTTVEVSKSVKVRLRPRHEERLASLAVESGVSIPDLARMTLIQFLFGANLATPLPLPPQTTVKSASTKHKLAIAKTPKAKKLPNKATSTPKTPIETPTKPKGRQLFADL